MSLVSTLLALASLPITLADEPNQYLLISQPKLQKVVYMKFSVAQKGAANFLKDENPAPIDLIVDGLSNPMGLAVDPKTDRLFVADPALNRILKYQLVFGDGKLVATDMDTAAQDVEAKWVAVDGVGNLFFTNEKENLIQKIDSESVRTGFPQRIVTLYDASGARNTLGVSSPAGITADNFHVRWANKGSGTQVGSIVQGMENPDPHLKRLSHSNLKSYGVCLSQNNLYYTDEKHHVYGMLASGGTPTIVTDKLKSPRGCVWDGDGTIFVADSTGDGIYSFSGASLLPTRISKVGSVTDPWGLAVISATLDARIMFSSLAAVCISLHMFL